MFLLLLLIFIFSVVDTVLANNITVVSPTDGYVYVNVSLKDISRIHCSTDIKSTVYSKEKSIEVKTTGRDAYIKLLPKRDQVKQTLIYEDYPREIFVECDSTVYSLVLVPKDLPSQTIILRNNTTDIKKAIDFESLNDYESTLLSLIKSAYLEVPPDGYRVKWMRTVKNYKEVELITTTVYEGYRFEVWTYLITAKEDVELSEKNFLTESDKNTAAISILKPSLKAGESTRMFIVRRRTSES